MGKEWLGLHLLFPLLRLKILSREYFDAVLGHAGGFVTQRVIVSVGQHFEYFINIFHVQMNMFRSPGES